MFNPSLSSFVSFRGSAVGPLRRESRLSQRGCSDSKDSYEERAKKVNLCRDRLMSAIRDVNVLLKRARIGFKRVLYAEAMRAGLFNGLRSVSRLYSSFILNELAGFLKSAFKTRTSATDNNDSTHVPKSFPAAIVSIVSARSTTRLPCVSRHLRVQFPRISAYPRWASLRVDRMAGAAGCVGCVVGSGKVRRNATRGRKVFMRDEGNGVIENSVPGGGTEPEEPSATSLVYSCVSFLAPVSMRRACRTI